MNVQVSQETAESLLWAGYLAGRFLELALLLLDDAGRPAGEVWSDFLDVARSETRLLERLAQSPRAGIVGNELVEVRKQQAVVARELNLRAARNNPAVAAIALAESADHVLALAEGDNEVRDFEKGILESLKRALRIEHLTDYRNPNGSEDLRADAMAGVFEHLTRLANKSRSATVVLGKDVDSLARGAAVVPKAEDATILDERRWPRLVIYRWGLEAALWGFLPPLITDQNTLSGIARGTYRNAFRARDAQKRGGAGRKRPEANAEPGAESTGAYPKAAVHVPLSEIREEDNPKSDPQDEASAMQIIEAARTHLGKRAASYFKEIKAGATQKEAAKAANVSGRMARKYAAKMRALLGTPPKKK